MYDIERIHRPGSVQEAVKALLSDPEAVVICGGSDVLIKIREGKLAGCSLVSVRDIKALHGIDLDEDGDIVIGPASTFHEVTEHPIIREHIPWLGEATDQAGGPQLRNIGTIGGNVCNGAPSADSAPILLAMNAQLTITGENGERTVALEDFYAGPGRVHLSRGDLLTAIRIRRTDYERCGGFYIKYAQRNAMDIATIGCAAVARMTPDKERIEDFRLAYGVAAPTPVRCHKTEEMLKGQSPAALAEEGYCASVLSELSPRDSWRASKALRIQIIREVARRAAREAITRAGGTIA